MYIIYKHHGKEQLTIWRAVKDILESPTKPLITEMEKFERDMGIGGVCKGWTVKGIRNQNIRELLAETLGTFLLTLFNTATACQLTLSRGTMSNYFSLNLNGGIGVAIGVYACGNVSGGAVNPAVTLAFCLTNRTPWRRLPFHWIGQFIGAFLAAAVTYGIYIDAIDNYDGGQRQAFGPNGTASLFTSFPQPYISTSTGFLDQVVGAALLIGGILFIIDPRNMAPDKGLAPLISGLLVSAIGGTFGLNCNYPINPARDLSPRLFIMAAGWSTEVFSHRNYNWFWVPILGPLTGSLVGTLIYYLFVAFHWPPLDNEQQTGDGLSEKPNGAHAMQSCGNASHHHGNSTPGLSYINGEDNSTQHGCNNNAFSTDSSHASSNTKF